MESILEYSDYRKYLRDKLEESLKTNADFSLRAFARKCKLSASHLSRIMRGLRGLSAKQATILAQSLGLSPEEKNHLLSMIGNIPGSEEEASSSYHVLDMEKFRTISEWHHFAILALVKTMRFRAEPKWIAHRLNININTASHALQRLQELGLLYQKAGRWYAAEDGMIQTAHDIVSVAVRENHRQHLQLAAQSLETISIDLREFENASIPMRLKDIPEAKKRIRTFLDRFIKDFEVNQAEEVFQINVQLHPLTKIDKGRV